MKPITRNLTRHGLSIFTLSLILTYSISSYGQNAQQIHPLQIDSATVFLKGAELSSSALLSLPKGESEVLLSNIAQNRVPQSELLNVSNGVSILSVTPYLDNRPESEIPELNHLIQQIEQVELERSKLNTQVEALDTQINLLQGQRAIPETTRVVTDGQAREMLDLIAQRLPAILLEKINQQQAIKQLDRQLAELQEQYKKAKLDWTKTQSSQLRVKLYAPQAMSSQVKLSYAIDQAGWQPSYDIKVDKPSGAVQVSYNANIYQGSDLDWNKVALTLSTSNPAQGVTAPTLAPNFLQVASNVPMLKSASNVMSMAPSSVQGSAMEDAPVADSVAVDNSGINTRFLIEMPYTIPTDGQPHLVNIKQLSIPAEFSYVAIPKYDQDVFLQAKLRDWQGYNLLPGPTAIFFAGAYVGQGNLDPQGTDETLTISLGRDKQVSVQRQQNHELKSSASLFGNDKRQSFAYTINARNNRQEPITLVIMDQIPVSQDSQITIVDEKYSGATLDKEQGRLEWKVELAPSEQRKIDFSYGVKYPSDKRIIGL